MRRQREGFGKAPHVLAGRRAVSLGRLGRACPGTARSGTAWLGRAGTARRCAAGLCKSRLACRRKSHRFLSWHGEAGNGLANSHGVV